MEPSSNSRLHSLLENAYNTCVELRDYTKDNFYVFEGDDDEKILEFIQEREKYLNVLTKIEYDIDLLFEEEEDYNFGGNLPAEIEDIRLSIRTVLDGIESFDIEAIKHVSSKMQKYKIETMKVRNKKHLSSYFKSDTLEQENNIDFTK